MLFPGSSGKKLPYLTFTVRYSLFNRPLSLKKAVIILTLALFTLSTLVMPYANFDDVTSLQAVYNNCLKQDADMDFLEFIGEKLLVAGFDPEEDEENDTPCSQQPLHGDVFVQIQSGALFRHIAQEINLELPVSVMPGIPLRNTIITAYDFHPGIFHPPLGS